MVEWKKLGEVCKTVSPPKKLEKELYGNVGLYPIIDQGQKEIVGFTDDVTALLPYGEYVLFGDHTRFVKYYRGKFAQGADGLKILKANESIIPRYFFYAFDNTEVPSRGYSRHWSIAKELLIPIPSLSEQSRIVSILDTFTSSISNLKQQIEERRKQYEYERDLLLDLEGKEGVEMKKLGEVGDICMCKRIMKDQTSEKGDIPFFKIGTFGGKADAYISRELFEDYKEKYSYPKKGEILISAAGTIGRTVVFNGEDAYFQDSNIVWISNNEQLVLNTFLRYLYGVIDWKIDGGTIKRLYNYNLKNATIYVPTLQAQSRIVSILDTFEQSIANLEEQLAMREKQYEYYRNQLLTFEGEEERGKT